MKEIVLVSDYRYFKITEEMYKYMLEQGYESKKNDTRYIVDYDKCYENCKCNDYDSFFHKTNCEKKEKIYCPCEEDRTNSFLIDCVKKFKNYSYLYICCIPENVDWQINYLDRGYEFIEEKHIN